MDKVSKHRAVPLYVSDSNTEDNSHQGVTVIKHRESHLFPVFERDVEREAFFFFSRLAKNMNFMRPECVPKASENETCSPGDDGDLNSNIPLT